jgi:hypothetical protein
MKISLVGAEMFDAEGQTDTFRNAVNAPKIFAIWSDSQTDP